LPAAARHRVRAHGATGVGCRPSALVRAEARDRRLPARTARGDARLDRLRMDRAGPARDLSAAVLEDARARRGHAGDAGVAGAPLAALGLAAPRLAQLGSALLTRFGSRHRTDDPTDCLDHYLRLAKGDGVSRLLGEDLASVLRQCDLVALPAEPGRIAPLSSRHDDHRNPELTTSGFHLRRTLSEMGDLVHSRLVAGRAERSGTCEAP